VASPEPAEVLGAYARVQRAADADILRVLRDAYRETNRDLQMLARSSTPGSAIRRDQLRAIKRQILESQSEIFDRTGRVIEARRTQAAARAIRVAGRYDEALFAEHGRGPEAAALTRGLEATETRTIDAAIARMMGSSVPLSARVYRARTFADGALERRINSGLARGLSAEQMARELRDFVNPNTPGGQRYAAMRLARTEINNAFHAMSIRAAQLKPWITKMEWHTSKSHPRLDECDALNGRLFPVDEVPKKPHPQDMCYVTPVVDATDDDDAFLDSLVNGDFDSFLDDVAERHALAPVVRLAAVVAAPTGFRPGQWREETRESILQERIDGFSRGWRSSTETDEQHAARVRQMAEDTTPPGMTRLTNGTTALEFLHPTSEAQRRMVQKWIEGLQETNPIDPMTVYLRDMGDPDLGGETVARVGRSIALNVTWINRPQPGVDSTWHMPAASFTNQLRYSLTHEWGHIVTPVEEERITELLRDAPPEDLSDYARTRPDEATAELFAEFYLHSGQPDYSNPTADRLAALFGWRRRP
jgi:SPP1 gp7 family putative phage head morphogenesis protein